MGMDMKQIVAIGMPKPFKMSHHPKSNLDVVNELGDTTGRLGPEILHPEETKMSSYGVTDLGSPLPSRNGPSDFMGKKQMG